jgi:diguanylate cyclase (GGDEF)-like protein
LSLLLVEDSAADGRLVVELLREAGVQWQLERVDRVRDAQDHLRRHRVDCVLLDLGVLDADGLDGLSRLVGSDAELPVVVLTRRDDAELSTEALRQGAQDYLSKRDLAPTMLARAVRYAIERKTTELQLLHLAHHDTLTGVANRALYLDRLGAALALDAGAAVLFIDVDNLKLVNDSLGHEAGDRLLRTVADRLRSALRPTDTLGRVGGDEFAVVCPGAPSVAVVRDLATRLTTEVAQPLVLGTRVYVPTVSIGVALSRPRSGDTAEVLVGNADLALYRAKKRGKARFEVFEDAMRTAGRGGLALLTELRTAFVEDQLRVHFQPEVSLATGELVAVEALLRWEHPLRGLVVAGEFIDALEDSDMLAPLGGVVLEQACALLRRWPSAAPPRVAVNVSARQLSLAGFADGVAQVVAERGLAADLVELEVTESALLVDDASAQVLRDLHHRGFRLAVDDFGTGYSSLNHLKLFPASTVKVDRSFVAGLGQDPVDEAIVTAVIGVAVSLGLSTVGEGVETQAQHDRLLELGCDLGQGHLHARAMPANELLARYAR